MLDDDLLPERIVAGLGVVTLAVASPYSDEGDESEHVVIQVGALPQICGVVGRRKIVERRQIAPSGHSRAFFRIGYSLITAGNGRKNRFGTLIVRVAHDSSVTKRYTTYSANHPMRMDARTSRTSKKMTTFSS
ncbi:hypothetical protein GCM10007304_41080 [Rhodococcoides trifolii]|uniref:Uncharacterized protein n=1 Tax=Rhodococcoides trifolii TaxID=908250 RepID=A0A917G4X5_9NOCA|nr:hypothetical protein GCM10007304_41080 [Rhodococcus trifolii]